MLIVTAAVVTNAGISVFTLTQFGYLDSSYKIWAFIIFQWACFGVLAILVYIVPSTPMEVDIQRSRKRFLVSKIIDKVPDSPLDLDSRRHEEEFAASTSGSWCWCWAY